MIATDLTGEIWNAIADLVARSQSPREIYFVKVKKTDKTKLLIWTEEFGDMAIPLVSHGYGFAYYDTVPVGNAHDGAPVDVQVQKRYDATDKKDQFQTHIICPDVGQVVAILDPWGAKRFPFCIGVVQSKTGFWEGE